MTDSGVTAEQVEVLKLRMARLEEAGDEVENVAEAAAEYDALSAVVPALLAMRKLDPALAIPNDEGMREVVAEIVAIQPDKLGWGEALDNAICRARKALAATPSPVEHKTKAALFQSGNFTLASGAATSWKIECDRLTTADWSTLAAIAVGRLAPFGSVEGVPNGGTAFADALRPYATKGPLLIAEDVVTTGKSMEEHRRGREAIGVAAFARGSVPTWVTPLFALDALPPRRLVEQMQDVVREYLPPDSGISEHEALNRLIGLLDGPEQRRSIRE